jgi:hypothetical protein
MKLTKKQISGNKERLIFLLQETKREGIDGFVEWLRGTDFFSAPASTRMDYHGAHEGGLAQHCLNVYAAFEEKAKMYELGLRHDERTVASICHDMCKINTYHPNVLKSGRLSEAKPYVVEDAMPLGHGEKSMYIASQFIRLMPNEALLIRWHMGPFDSEWENYEAKVAEKCPAIYAFQTADMEASKYMDLKAAR